MWTSAYLNKGAGRRQIAFSSLDIAEPADRAQPCCRIPGGRMTDDEVLALAQPALRRMAGGSYRQAPLDKTGLTVPSKDVRRLVEKGALIWVNRCRSAAAKPSSRGLHA
jgi:hypothetical protein